MSRFRRSAALAAASLILTATVTGTGEAATPASPPPVSGPVIGAYYAGGNSAEYPVARIPADTITHLFYAFSTIEQGKCVVQPGAAADFAALAELKREHPKLRTLISIGGWGAGGFSDAALTTESRRQLASSCIDLFFGQYRGSFDGIDLDWEFPVYGGPSEITDRPADRRNMTLLSQEFRGQLDRLGRQCDARFLLTAALPAGRLQTDGPYDPAKSFDLRALGRVLDFVNLMTYDMGTGFSTVATFNAPLREVAQDPLGQPMRRWNNVLGAVEYYRQHGVPADRLVLGVPFYGRGFQVRQAGQDNGLYQPYERTFDVGGWRNIQALLKDPAWQQHWHPVARSPWLYNAAERRFASFENPESIGIRARTAERNGLLGAFMWELSQDDAEHSLLTAMSAPFRG
ncbi:glycoside hydrolase family 18 protein [Amycolatopsis nigrescens]|uniref:glycoside hydrolase family 18 protein n=1 Tax=Amycolatopsis nigrescens TaxID=381445 RepID=UPI000361BDA0|nr:glycoside hydrolase family 18 protein [Amycolatopsis nigrescens]